MTIEVGLLNSIFQMLLGRCSILSRWLRTLELSHGPTADDTHKIYVSPCTEKGAL